MNNVDDGMLCAGVDQGGDSQYLMLMAMEEVERWMMVVAKLERMQSRMKVEMMANVKRVPSRRKSKAAGCPLTLHLPNFHWPCD